MKIVSLSTKMNFNSYICNMRKDLKERKKEQKKYHQDRYKKLKHTNGL